MKKQSLIYFTSSAAALLAGLVNPAQSVAQAATPQAAPAANSPGAQAATADGPAIADIVVTAQRRRESLQKTAVVLSVLSSEALARAGVTQPQALASILPGVQIGNAGPLLQVYVRGVGDAGVGATSNPAVAFNIDVTPSLYYLLGYRPIANDEKFGRPLFTETSEENRSYQRNSYLVSVCYNPIYGILGGDGKTLFIANEMDGVDQYFDLVRDPDGVVNLIDNKIRARGQTQIREHVQDLADFYRYQYHTPTLLAWAMR